MPSTTHRITAVSYTHLDVYKRQAQCRAFLDALGIVQTASVHHEADDEIGTWVTQQHARGKACQIISGDKDLAQLVGSHDHWWDYGKRAALTAVSYTHLDVYKRQVRCWQRLRLRQWRQQRFC